MKKVISIALFAAAFGLVVGCSSSVQDKADATSYRENVSQTDAGKASKCKNKKCRGKLGAEKMAEDTAK